MKHTIGLAALLVVGTSAIGAGALDLRGAEFNSSVVALLNDPALDCGGVGNSPSGDLVFVESGSSNGQSGMVGNTQEIAPMTRFMNTGVCTGTAAQTNHADGTAAEGIVFALDGIAVLGNATFASCAGTPSCGTDDPVGGLRNSGLIPGTSFVVSSWRDALRLLYTGLTGPSLSTRNCGSPERAALAASWNAMFQSCSSTSCPAGIQHAFRRDDQSESTGTFLTLIQAASILVNTHVSPFCNARTRGSGGVNGSGAPATQQLLIPAEVMPAPPPGRTAHVSTNITVCANSSSGYRGSYFTDFQDGDVIRRPCAFAAGTAQEDVCSARGDLGLVLPIWDAPAADPFPTATCTQGAFACFPASRTNCTAPNTYETCPNGHDANVAGICPVGQCAAPIFTGGGQLDPRCNALRGTNAPGDLTGVIYDGRVHNLTTWNASGSNFVRALVPRETQYPPPIPFVASVAMAGAFYRIHSVNSLATPAVHCHATGAAAQISCLIQASPCSIGFSDFSAIQGNTIGLNVDNVAPTDECVQNQFDGSSTPYPLTRKLYLNTVDGFEALVAGTNQYKMARCFANGAATAKAVGEGAIPLAGGPVCEDFDETQAGCNLSAPAACGGAPCVNSNACAGNPF